MRQRGVDAVMSVPWLRISLVLLTLSLLACDRGPTEKDGVYKAEVGEIPASPQRPGDPDTGYGALLNRSVVTCGLPYSAYLKTRGAARDAGPQFPGRTGRNAELPYMLTSHVAASGVEIVTSNCLACHASTFNGELVMGLGNEFLDLTADPLIGIEAAAALVEDGPEATEWRRWADRIGAIADYMMTDTVGVNSASNLTLALMAHRDPETLAWSDTPLMEPPPQTPLPVSVPPWWNMGKKHAMFYNGEGRGDHVRYMMLASTTCTDTVEEAAEIDAWFVDVRAYLASLQPPEYPFAIDRVLAERGASVFEKTCKECHGTYGDEPTYPNRVIALGKIKTDPELARKGFSDADRFLKWFGRSFYGELSQAAPALGYVAPPLDGVWATAPYLHNGSVPTIAALLDSRSRPTYWRFDRDGDDRPLYDDVGLGWAYRALENGKAGAMSWDERNHIYDTSLPGYGNQGHTFGDDLTDPERLALLEYLKTL
jgi:mono/diheme cytochrome c family protein